MLEVAPERDERSPDNSTWRHSGNEIVWLITVLFVSFLASASSRTKSNLIESPLVVIASPHSSQSWIPPGRSSKLGNGPYVMAPSFLSMVSTRKDDGSGATAVSHSRRW